MTFTKILCPIDFSAGSERALRVASRLAVEKGAELVIVHAWQLPATSYVMEAPVPLMVTQAVIDDAQRGLDAAVRDVTPTVKRVRGELLSGVPWVEIVDFLEKQSFEICVIGTHGRTGLARIMLGSVAEKVVRHAPCSVLAVRPDGEVKPFRHVLVPTDFSESADDAIALAAALTEPGGSISLLHVMEVPVAFTGEIRNADLARAIDKAATKALGDVATKLRDRTSLAVETRFRMGYPGAQILAALDDDRTIDLVVMGSHGRTGIMRALLGSVAEKLVRHARCPVLVSRQRSIAETHRSV